jgi:hypothetical protein
MTCRDSVRSEANLLATSYESLFGDMSLWKGFEHFVGKPCLSLKLRDF